MKTLSLIQPWATLITIGEKEYETRSWKTKYRGDLLIHASKKIDKEICDQEPFKSILAKHGYNQNNLPTGIILAKCNLVDIFKTEDIRNNISYNEFSFGFYDDNRYAWKLENIEPLENPILAKGKLNLWNYDLKL